MRPRFAWFLLALVAAGCAPKSVRLPSGPETPVSDSEKLFTTATAACRATQTLTAEATLSGRVNERKFRARLIAGLQRPDAIRLEALAPFGGPVLIFVAREGKGTLLLARENRALVDADPSAVLEALIGLPLSAPELIALVSGCVAPDPVPLSAFGYGPPDRPDWIRIELRAATGRSVDVYLKDEESQFRIVAAVFPTMIVEYSDSRRATTRSFRLRSRPENVSPIVANVDLRLTLSDIDVNVPLASSAFRLELRPDARPLTLRELREAGPLAGTTEAKR